MSYADPVSNIVMNADGANCKICLHGGYESGLLRAFETPLTDRAMPTWTMFNELSDDNRLGVVAQFVGSVIAIDPALANADAIWRLGKTVAVECTIGGRPTRIHLSGTPALVRRLGEVIQAGRLVLSSGAADIGGVQRPAWIGSFGFASVCVTECADGLLISVAEQRAVPIPEGLRQGQPVPFPLPDGEGFIATLFCRTLLLVGSFGGLRPAEIKALRNAPISVGLARYDDKLSVIGLRVPDFTNGWTDLPFALGVERRENRALSAPDSRGCMKALLVVADALTGIASVVRPLPMSAAWTGTLHSLLEVQQDCGDLDRNEYSRLVSDSRRKWTTPDAIAGDFVVVERVRKVTQ